MKEGDEILELKEGSILLIPSDSIPLNAQLDDCSELSSVYSGAEELAMDAREDFEESAISEEEILRTLLKFGVDRDGLPIRPDLFFPTFNEAAEFQLSANQLPDAAKWMGYQSQIVEIPHVVLWDYFGGSSCLTLNCVAGDVVNVIAEEYQVRKVNPIFKDGGEYLRLPRRWALARWTSAHREFQPIVGLIPTCWLVNKTFYDANEFLFRNPTWFLGICDILTAFETLTNDRGSYRDGLFVVSSPVWLNLHPDDHRPFLLLVMIRKPQHLIEEAVRMAEKFAQPGVGVRLLTQKIQKLLTESQNRMANPMAEEPPLDPLNDEVIADSVRSPFHVKCFTITRTSIGRYRLFDRQYETLYDLVVDLSARRSKLPHPLSGGPRPLGAPRPIFDTVPPPTFRTPHRDIDSLTMFSEQMAARHYDQITDLFQANPSFEYAISAKFNPFKASHLGFAQSAQMRDTDIQRARAHCAQFERPVERDISGLLIPSPEAEPKLEKGEKLKPLPTNEMHFRPLRNAEIDTKNISFDPEKVLGSGQFGMVFLGAMRTAAGTQIEVALKKLKIHKPKDERRQPFVQEIETLQVLSHPNVIGFYGFYFDEHRENIMMVCELMQGGNLKEFITKSGASSLNEQIDFLLQIAHGMSHLHSFDPPIIHGDLAARNVLMSPHPVDRTRFVLKVTDFGLSRTCRHDAHCLPDEPTTIPFKWLPPEVLRRGEFSVKADIWSFGIVATEIYGVELPYGAGIETRDLLPHLTAGHRMDRPQRMPNSIYSLLLQCWRMQPIDRPTFSELIDRLEPMVMECEAEHLQMIEKRFNQKA